MPVGDPNSLESCPMLVAGDIWEVDHYVKYLGVFFISINKYIINK